MITLDPHVVIAVAFSCCVGWLMLTAGVQKSALEWRRRRRVCPSCGRDIRSTRCNCSA